MGTNGKLCVYCAGPLFNAKEREEMQEMAAALEDAGFATFLPQRDGLELAECIELLVGRGIDRGRAARLLSRAIFALDVFQVLEACDATLVNLNGRVPDEGAVAEVAMAWARGKTVIGYKADSRSLVGGEDNPLVAGLFGFQIMTTIGDAVGRLTDLVGRGQVSDEQERVRGEEIQAWLALGGEIWHALSSSRDVGAVAEIIASDSTRSHASA